jgi:aspartate-semialdehyde dehydrogenase
MDRLRVGVLGPTGMMGQRFVQMLCGHPCFELAGLYVSRSSIGKRYSEAVSWKLGPSVPEQVSGIRIAEPKAKAMRKEKVDLVFSALPSESAATIEKPLSVAGIHVVTNSSYHRMDPDVPLMIPEVNGDHLRILQGRKRKGILVTNPNCSTTGLVMGLDPIRKLIGSEVFVSTYQALSGAGYPGVASLDIMGNVVPFIRDEEDKLIHEPAKILGELEGEKYVPADIRVVANCVRVPVRDGHTISVAFKVKKGATRERIISHLTAKKGIRDLPSSPVRPISVRDEEDRPRPDLDAFAGDPPGMVVTAGRIRVDDGIARMFFLVNNTIRGGAGNSILIAEQCLKEGYI